MVVLDQVREVVVGQRMRREIFGASKLDVFETEILDNITHWFYNVFTFDVNVNF